MHLKVVKSPFRLLLFYCCNEFGVLVDPCSASERNLQQKQQLPDLQ